MRWRWILGVGSALLAGCSAEPRIERMAELDLGPRTTAERVEDRAPLSFPRHVLDADETYDLQRPDPPTPTASTSYGGYGPERLLDGNPATSWFSASNDSAAHGTEPFVELGFAHGRRIRAVTILGNREPSWTTGFSVREGRLDLFDADGNVVWSASAAASGASSDFVFETDEAVWATRVRFTSTRDDGAQNGWGDVAIAEIAID